MKIDTKDMVNVSDASSKGVSWLVREAENGRMLLIVKNSEPAVVIANVEAMTRLERVDEAIENLRLLSATLVRVAADDGVRHDLDDVLKDLGIDVDE